MEAALEDAGADRREIGYLSAHGTGTPANDRAEVAAARALFGKSGPPMSSIKAITGHGLGAASALEAVACVQALREQIAPPTWNFTRADPDATGTRSRTSPENWSSASSSATPMPSAAPTHRSSCGRPEMAVVLGTGWITPDHDFDVAEHLELRGLRPLARASRLACVAAASALRHPEPLPGRTGALRRSSSDARSRASNRSSSSTASP